MSVFDHIFVSFVRERETPEQLMIDAAHLKAHREVASLLNMGMFTAVLDARRGT